MPNSKPKPWVVGNWKMNPVTQVAQQQLTQQIIELGAAKSLTKVKLAIAPACLHLISLAQQLQSADAKILPVAQDVSPYSGSGAYTGDVSAQMLIDAGVQVVLIGHSERRSLYAETADILRQKLQAATDAGMQVVFCLGETLSERMAGEAEQVVLQQIAQVFDSIPLAMWQQQVMIAYEPIWAIGTGQTASPEDAQNMHLAIRRGLKSYHSSLESVSILYGGSVKPDNAAALAACADINGALVGGASLDADSFIKIAQAFSQ